MATTQIPKDFREFLKLLNDHGVEYLLVGAHAVNYHGYVRSSGDLDVWVAVGTENAKKLVSVLKEFGFSEKSVQEDLFLEEDKVIQIGIPPMRIDILLGVSGLDFATCYSRRIVEQWGGQAVNFLSLEDLKTNKLASGRLKDLNDLEHLP